MTEIHDDFRGDDAALIRSSEAMINLSDRKALVPHGLGGSARALLAAFIVRMRARMNVVADGAPPGFALAGYFCYTDNARNHMQRVNDIHKGDPDVFPLYGRIPPSAQVKPDSVSGGD